MIKLNPLCELYNEWYYSLRYMYAWYMYNVGLFIVSHFVFDWGLLSLRTADVSPRSSPLRDVSRGGTFATQRQKFHTDDINQCLHNKFSSHGVPNANLFNFTFSLVDFGRVLCSFANELQQNSNTCCREDYIPQILAVLLESLRLHLTNVAFCLLSVIRKAKALLTGFRTEIASSVWNFCHWVTDVPPRETSLSGDERGETSAVRRLGTSQLHTASIHQVTVLICKAN